MPDSSDHLDKVKKKIRETEATGLENQNPANLGTLTPTNPMEAYVQGLEDRLKAVYQEGKNLLNRGVTNDEKTLTHEYKPEHGLDR